ncbi:osiris 18 [Sergentomyia squamirostris]
MLKLLGLLLVVYGVAVSCTEQSAADVVRDIYKSCLSEWSTDCVKPKSMSWLKKVAQKDEIRLTEELSLVRTAAAEPQITQDQNLPRELRAFDKIDEFLTTHSLRIQPPMFLQDKTVRKLVPKSLLKGGLAETIEVPLSEGNVAEGRGFVKKVMIPFLLGLKLKTFGLVPLAITLIALKTWKAMTLSLLSLVVAGAIVIFRLSKPKVVNYEVVHYPHHHHVDHHLDHHVDHAHLHFDPPQGWSRQMDAQQMAYAGYV